MSEYYEENRETILEQKKAYYKENREAILEKRKEYQEENAETITEYKRLYREKYAEELKVTKAAYYQANKVKILKALKVKRQEDGDSVREAERRKISNNPQVYKDKDKRSGRKRRAAKVNVQEDFLKTDEEFIKFKFDNRCFNCKTESNLQFDHHYPLSLGFALTRENCTLLCASCNSSKGNKLPKDFYSIAQLNTWEEL